MQIVGKTIKKLKEPRVFVPLILAAMTVFIMLFAVQNSPFYSFNEWVDPNCFMTVGKGILAGKVPYRDLYEQKGPYVYFIHAVCAAIDGDSFIGVWLMELICCFLFLFFVYKILLLHDVDSPLSVTVVCALIGCTVYFSLALGAGDSVEEMCNPLFLSIVYLTLKRIKKDESFRLGDYLYIGVVAGFVFWSKFTLVGFFIGWYAYFLYRVIRRKEYSDIGKSVGLIATGVIVATLPCLFYFAAHHAIGDWLKVYIFDNLFVYSAHKGFFGTIGTILKKIVVFFGQNVQFTLPVLFGIVWFSLKKETDEDGKVKEREHAGERAFLLIVPVVMTVILYIGGVGFRYYGLPIACFSVFGYIAVLQCDFAFLKKRAVRLASKIVLPVVSAFSCCLFFCINGNVNYIFRPREEITQYKFAKIINEKEDSTLLNYGFLDGGFYQAAGKVPDFKYFAQLNIPLKEMKEEQNRYVKEGIPDFVVVKIWRMNTEELKAENYREVMRSQEIYRGVDETEYILYERIE